MPRAWGSRVSATVAGASAVAGLLGIGSAFACTNLATISLSSGFGHPGDKVTIIGSSFPVPRPTSATPATPVVIRWRSIDGPVIADAVPDRTGSISATFTVPPSEPGNVVIVAVQRRPIADPAAPETPPSAFVDEAGTPARASFRILGPGEFAPTSVPFSPVLATGDGDGGSTALLVLMVLFGAVALSLFAGGIMAFLHQVRTRPGPARQVWPPY